MNLLIYYILCFVLVLLGTGGYFAYNQEWMIFHIPSMQKKNTLPTQTNKITKKIVNRIFWHHNRWNTEQTELLWSDDKAENCIRLIASWLLLLEEEHSMSKKVTIQSVILSPSGADAYCSFDRNPFDKNHATFDKLMWIEGFLKTIRENGIKIQTIQFLVHHQPLNDFHLDFSNPWPITGFLET